VITQHHTHYTVRWTRKEWDVGRTRTVPIVRLASLWVFVWNYIS